MDIPLRVIKWCANEVERQEAGPQEVYAMANAWHRIKTIGGPVKIGDLMMLANLVESQSRVNTLSGRSVNWRSVPVYARSAMKPIGSKPGDIPDHMHRWWSQYEDTIWPALNGGIAVELGDPNFAPVSEETTNELCKWLLDIHPWEDGNGRTTSLLYNWLRATLDQPVPLPFYYGEHKT